MSSKTAITTMPLRPPGLDKARTGCRRPGFSLVEVVIAIALFATVLLGMLALLANGINTRAEVRRDTLSVQICHQIHQALRGYRLGMDDLQPAKAATVTGLLDEFLPFDFSTFPGDGKPAFVLGFDAEGKPRGQGLAADYEGGSEQDGVLFLATLEGRPVTGKPGLTEVIIGVEHPASDKRTARQRKEFRVLMTPGAMDEPTPTANPSQKGQRP
jgi:type II secretory pathway pseudopilin PulG